MNRPQPKKEIEMEALIELCERHLDFIQTYNRVGYTFIGTIWEEVMQAVYGQEIHEWVKAQCHGKMILGVPDDDQHPVKQIWDRFRDLFK